MAFSSLLRRINTFVKAEENKAGSESRRTLQKSRHLTSSQALLPVSSKRFLPPSQMIFPSPSFLLSEVVDDYIFLTGKNIVIRSLKPKFSLKRSFPNWKHMGWISRCNIIEFILFKKCLNHLILHLFIFQFLSVNWQFRPVLVLFLIPFLTWWILTGVVKFRPLPLPQWD